MAPEFDNFDWDYNEIEDRKKGSQYAEPFVITLDKLLIARN